MDSVTDAFRRFLDGCLYALIILLEVALLLVGLGAAAAAARAGWLFGADLYLFLVRSWGW